MLKKIYQSILTDFYKIDIIRTLIVVLRYLYFDYIKKDLKYFIGKNDIDENHRTIIRDGERKTVISYNLHFKQNLLNFKKTYRKFNGEKTAKILYPLKSIPSISYNDDKVLSVGPRNEGELYLIRSFGFKWKNIYAIDLISYSNKILLGDIHNTNYPDNQFNIILCGWVLHYSQDYKKVLKELIRISKNGCIISIGSTYNPKIKCDITNTKQIYQFLKNDVSKIYFNTDENVEDVPQKKRHSIIIFEVKK